MGILTEQLDPIIKQIESAADNALLTTMHDGLIQALYDASFEIVYSYPNRSEFFAAKRRYTIADESNFVITDGGSLVLKLRNKAVTQGGEPGEINWVETGFRQDGAGARPFMDYGLAVYARGRASEDLVSALQAAGFDAHVG